MIGNEPVTELEPQFSSSDAQATTWQEARTQLEQAELFWLSTVRPDNQPHVTPLLAVWLDDALYFCTGDQERKAKNLDHNANCVLTTGCNTLNAGLDLVIEGQAVRAGDTALLQRVAELYESKYGSDWRFTVVDNKFQGSEGNVAIVYEVRPTKAFGFGKGATFSQTRWRF